MLVQKLKDIVSELDTLFCGLSSIFNKMKGTVIALVIVSPKRPTCQTSKCLVVLFKRFPKYTFFKHTRYKFYKVNWGWFWWTWWKAMHWIYWVRSLNKVWIMKSITIMHICLYFKDFTTYSKSSSSIYYYYYVLFKEKKEK